MKRLLNPIKLAGPFALGLCCVSQADVPPDNAKVVFVEEGKLLCWDGQPGRTYFIQTSDPNEIPADTLLQSWLWMPDFIEPGAGAPIQHEIVTTADKAFFRIWHTEESKPPGVTLEDWDADNDGLSNYTEISLYQTNPIDPDTDDDGRFDGVEVSGGTNPKDADSDDDGLTDGEEVSLQTDPNDPDSDDDGITDGGEVDQGTDPTDPGDTPEAEWFIVSGNLPAGKTMSRSRTITIPQGEKRVVLVAVASEEYPEYTGDSSEFNDKLSWTITPETGSCMSRLIYVNSRHDEWEAAAQESFTLDSYFPASVGPTHVEDSECYEAPENQDLSLEIDLSATNIEDGALPSTVIVAVLPVNITAAFGIGPDPIPGSTQTSRELLDAYLDGIKAKKNGDTWTVKGKDDADNPKLYVVDVVANEDETLEALRADGRIVIFDGHSNFGMGPNFVKATHKQIGDFANFGAGYTDIGLSYRGDGTEMDVHTLNENGENVPVDNPEAMAALERLGIEGFAYIVPQAGEIPSAPTNYKPQPLNDLRFESTDPVAADGQVFNKQGNGFNDEFHFKIDGAKRLMIDAPETDLPMLGYSEFFYNVCNSGLDYIENFRHGKFFYTTDTCFIGLATRIFVQGKVEAKTDAQILSDLNQVPVGTTDPNQVIYAKHNF